MTDQSVSRPTRVMPERHKEQQQELQTASRASRRDAIMDAATRAFGERGLDGASVDDIARTS